MRKMKASGEEFLATHPDAAKVYLTTKTFITSEAVTVYSVNGDGPVKFMEGMKTGFYLLPGTSSVEVCYSYTRPGLLHKNVTSTTDVVKKDLVVDAKKSYLLGFDRSEDVFTFVEYDPNNK
jgi:hypothetical protein